MADAGDVQDKRYVQSAAELLHGAVLLAMGKSKDGVSKWVRSMKYNPNFAMDNSGFITRSIWPELIEKAQKAARDEDGNKAIRLVNSYVKEETSAPSGITRDGDKEDSEDSGKGKKGARSWFFRGRK